MKKIDLGQIITILANVGVIAGIVFLGFELRQNNTLLKSQARLNLDANRLTLQLSVIENTGGIAELIVRARSGEELSRTDQYRLTVRRGVTLNNFESGYRELSSGALDEEDIPVGQWSSVFLSNPGMMDYWEGVKQTAAPEFVQFMEENVISR